MDHFAIISTMDEKEDDKYKKIKKYLPRKIYLYYLKRYSKIIHKESVYLGEKGDIIMLPFTAKEFEELDEEYKKSFTEKIIRENEIQYLYVESNLSKIIRKIDETLIMKYSTIVMYIMFTQVMEMALNINHIRMKDMRLTIIDSGDCKIEYILGIIIKDLNYLTIITQRPEYFSELVDIIYDDTGLLIEVVTEYQVSDNENNGKNVIVDLSKEHYRYQGKIVIDLENDMLKRQYQYSRTKDINVIYDAKLRCGNYIVNNELLGFYLLKNHPFLCEFIEGKNNGMIKYSLNEISKELNLKLDELIYL